MRPPERFVGYLLGLLVFGVCGHAAYSDECSDILSKGIRDELKYESFEKFRIDFKRFLLMTKEQKEQLSREGGGGLSLFGIVRLFGSAETEDLRQLRELLKLDETLVWEHQTFTSLQLSVVNKGIVKAWDNCMGRRSMATVYGAILGDQKKKGGYFIVQVNYRPQADPSPKAYEVTSLSVIGAKPVDNSITSGTKVNRFSSVSQVYQRTGLDPVRVVVNFKGIGPVVLAMATPEPPMEKAPPPPHVAKLKFNIRSEHENLDRGARVSVIIKHNGREIVPKQQILVGDPMDPDERVDFPEKAVEVPGSISDLKNWTVEIIQDSPGPFNSDPHWRMTFSMKAVLSNGAERTVTVNHEQSRLWLNHRNWHHEFRGEGEARQRTGPMQFTINS